MATLSRCFSRPPSASTSACTEGADGEALSGFRRSNPRPDSRALPLLSTRMVSGDSAPCGGANMIVFTTGRGSAYGCAPAPSLKLSTNTALWTRQEEDIDLNCGEIADGTASVDETGEQLFRLMLDTASGTKSKSERHGYGQSEFVPWYVGAVM